MIIPLSSLTEASKTQNVVVFISDSLRVDYLPHAAKEFGVHGEAIAGSTFTGSGFPTIVTGQYPSHHRIWGLRGQLANTPALLDFDQAGIDTERVWTNITDESKKPPLRMCGEDSSVTLDQLDPPFVHVVHDIGGHVIYGGPEEEDRWEDAADQYSSLRDQEQVLLQLYRKSVTRSYSRFVEICEQLKNRGIFDETLVILTSDHGEHLGEYGGIYGHGSPLTPEQVRVPLLFAGAGLPDGEEFTELASTADIVPTVYSALGEPTPRSVDGEDLWNSSIAERKAVRSEVWLQTSYPFLEYKAASVWTKDGGLVRHGGNVAGRTAHVLGAHYVISAHSPLVRKHRPILDLWRHSIKKSIKYGDVSELSTKSLKPKEFEKSSATSRDIDGPNKEQLRELGYLE
jgi:hypothetical protein